MSNSGRIQGKDICRACRSNELFIAYDLGLLPIANELLNEKQSIYDEFPLILSICRKCTLGQVQDVVSPQRLFQDYRYTSSTSRTFLEHASAFVVNAVRDLSINQKDDWVLEIASNDGYLLKNFIPLGIKTIGVEPSENIGQLASDSGIPTISTFFSSNLANEILASHGFPKLIIANNVLAHVPDIRDFMKGLSILCGPDTYISIENPSLLNILTHNQFDSIYHEHFSYLTANSVSRLAEDFELRLFDLEEIDTHGGSNRYWLKRDSVPSQRLNKMLSKETGAGITEQTSWNDSFQNVKGTLENLTKWLDEGRKAGRKIVGYGAAAKASTLLNLVKATPEDLRFIADNSVEKQGRFMPSRSIPIVDPKELASYGPTDVLIFPWNISDEIQSTLVDLCPDARYWKAIPEMLRIQ
jgi:hypothetical protein